MRQVSSQQQRSSSGGGPVWIVLIALLAALAVVAAEEPLTTSNVARIRGRLTLEGRPMQPGFSVVFMEPSRGDLAFGVTDEDGRFVVDSWKKGEMVPGRYKVYVMPPAVKPVVIGDYVDSDHRGDTVITLPAEYPDQYRNVESTPLEYKVVGGENRFEIDLERKSPESMSPSRSQ